MDFVMKQALGGATKDMGKMLGGDEEKDPDAAKKEEERQEALRQQEEERKAKYAKMEAEREVMRQGIRDKVKWDKSTLLFIFRLLLLAWDSSERKNTMKVESCCVESFKRSCRVCCEMRSVNKI
ncbi:complexin-1 isoform X2 [Cuculus canorus]|uniref:complexin-1 isoform X2 n=1 Tax=Cuculus canorus TaxID=55661 RepID=UPI0023AAE69D|nr:complexin-1 isoform X2 [Cuculus canorus]